MTDEQGIRERKVVVNGERITLYSRDGKTWVSDIYDLERSRQPLMWNREVAQITKALKKG